MDMITKLCVPEVRISEDRMSAKMKICLKDNGRRWTVEELKQLIESNNVKTEIIESAICNAIQNEIYDISIEVSKGKQSVPGKDGYFVYHVTMPDVEDAPKEMEDGSVEYVKTASYIIVEKGDLIAEYIPATNGEYGYTVEYNMLAPKKGKDLPKLRGKGFYCEDDKYYAATHGMVEITERGFRITNLLEVNGNVDINYGHIDFDGDVNIRGEVQSGMKVCATGNIEVKGHVGACVIEAGKNIIVHGGMQGKYTGKMIAGGDIECKFFENSQITAKGNIVVHSSIHSQLEAEGKVIAAGKNSGVLGGSIHAVCGMELTEVGNDTELETLIVAGVLPDTLHKDAELRDLIKKTASEVELLDRSAKVMERMVNPQLTNETNNRRMKIIQAKVIKQAELKKYQMEKAQIEALIQSGQNAQIVVQKTIYSGCHVKIADSGITVKQELKHVKFVLRDGIIEAALLY